MSARGDLHALPDPIADGDGCCRVTSAPMPTSAQMFAAQRSPAERRRVDLIYAAACGIEGDEVQPFLERLALYDVREAARQEEEAVRRLEDARKRRVEVESRGELERPRGKGVTRRLPRPRAA